jgi:hypothetical protein
VLLILCFIIPLSLLLHRCGWDLGPGLSPSMDRNNTSKTIGLMKQQVRKPMKSRLQWSYTKSNLHVDLISLGSLRKKEKHYNPIIRIKGIHPFLAPLPRKHFLPLVRSLEILFIIIISLLYTDDSKQGANLFGLQVQSVVAWVNFPHEKTRVLYQTLAEQSKKLSFALF